MGIQIKGARHMTLTLGTAKITEANGTVTVTYLSHGSFLVGSQVFGNDRHGWNAALRFCRVNALRVTAA
jgi:hypothetical protein